MTNLPLTPDQRVLGRENADRALGLSRRDLLKAAAATPALGAFYFGYKELGRPPVRAAIIGTGNEGCGAMIKFHNRAYVDFVGDDYETALKALVKRKASGKTIELPEPEEKPSNVVSLMDALKQSLKGRGGKKTAAKPHARRRAMVRRSEAL